ncbi:MAG: hypothetical protein SV377_08640 [Halobacteria archaeon]|nr:hypothetical protein [Halobacteria archaeon]
MRILNTSIKIPTRTNDWRLMFLTSRLVLTIPLYAVVAVVTALISLSFFVLSQNFELFVNVILFGDLSLSDRILVLSRQYPFIGGVYPPLEGGLLVIIATMFGIDLALLAYHFREHGVSVRSGSGSGLGLVLGALGAGCAACGTVILAGLLSFFGVAGALTLLPFHGLEFSVLAVMVLLLSIYWVADGMRGGEIKGCPIDI